MRRPALLSRHPTLAVAALYSLVAVAMTWPLVLGLGRDIPGDLGDPALNCWILGSNAEHLLRFFSGDGAALAAMWSPGIFHPEPLALAYSEHLVPQTVASLPLYAATGNVVLCYNLLFLSTYVLSALGAFLLVRDVTGDARAGFVAGLVFGFGPYRAEQMSHLQVLSSQWMPWTLWSLHRYFNGGRFASLAGAAAFLLLQNLSCGYYLAYFPPFVAAYALWELARRGRLTDARTWLQLVGAAVLGAGLTMPFLLPYLEVRASGGLVRRIEEVESFSADVYSYATAPGPLRLWGSVLRTYAKSEGTLFPSFTALILAAVAIAGFAAAAWAHTDAGGGHEGSRWRRVVVAVALVLGLANAAGITLAVAGLGEALPGLRIRNVMRPAFLLLVSAAVVVGLSRRARALIRQALAAPAFLAAVGAFLAFWLSLGPKVTAMGRPIEGAGLYGWLYRFVPGFDGLRAPARFAMVVVLFLSILAGLGTAALLASGRRRWLVALASLALLVESTAAPIVVNDVWRDYGLRAPPRRLLLGQEIPAIYDDVKALGAGAVLVELPFGNDPYELRYMLYALEHGRPLVNGFSGGFPPRYAALRARLAEPLAAPDRAWDALRASGATHVIVHEGVWWRRGVGRKVSAWLEAHGCRRVATTGEDVLFALP